MKLNSFAKTSRLLGIAALASTTLLTGCGSKVVSEGNFGLSQTWMSGTYNREPLGKGFNVKMLGSIDEYYGRQETIKIEDIHPKDKDGVLLKEADLTITYHMNKNQAVQFLVTTGDIEEKGGVYHLGVSRIDKDARNTIGATLQKYDSTEIYSHTEKVDEQYKKDFQEALDKAYGKNAVILDAVRLSNIRVADSIEQKIQNIAIINAEAAKNAATMAILQNREKTLAKEAETISNAAKAGGLTVDQMLQYETIKAIREGASTQVQVNTTPKAGKQ